ncbi:MAG TPA: cytochrome d ubiquinol oxidase subunit II, partial [Acidimicrobiales bacterium]|nr:cytochrome d ubiquinol oxidase subunit II [Acidimicrobiales bacterium]
MTLGDLWFIIDALFWVGFFILEGFDFGVGMLHSFLGRTDNERRVLINTIGPVWDGNEVWLIVAGAVIFAAFPGWYATMFSTFYLALVVLLLALMVRGVAFEYQRKFDDPRWRSAWRWGMTIGSALIPLLVGVALGDLLHGLPVNAQHEYTGNFFDLLTPFGLWSGVTLLVLSLMMGATYLTLKTTGELHARARQAATVIGVVAMVVTFGFMTWVHVG